MDSTPWLPTSASYRPANSANSSRHEYHLRWSGWDSPVSYNSHLRSQPLVHHDQRNGQSSSRKGINHPIPSPAYQDADLFDCFDHSRFEELCQGIEQEGQEIDTSSPRPDAVSTEDPPGDIPIADTFPESFFANPFAVLLPGDIPCPNTVSMAGFDFASTSAVGHASPTMEWKTPAPGSAWPVKSSSTTASTSPAAGLTIHSVYPGGSPRSQAAVAVAQSPAIKSPPKSSTKYASQIQFVDMADKKGAQRIRNTMNSRKHRQNKLDRIRELEKRLATSESEKDRWQGRAQELGWEA